VALAEALLMRHVEAKDDSWAEELVELYDQFLWSAFDSRQNPPHQALAFGFVKLLEWRPAEVVRELSPMRLTELTDKLEESLGEIGVCPRERLTDILSRMRTTFPKALRAILRDPRTRDTWHHLLDRSVGGIRFEEFYTSANREANVVQWWDAVRKRIARDVARRGAKDRIRVRAVEAETALRTADLTAFLLQEYLDGALRADRETEVENKLGTCAGEVAASARRLVRLRIALDHWNARSLALARVRWAIARALEVAEQDGPAGLVPRFRAWKTRWEGRAQAVVRRIEDRVVPFRERDWPDILVPSGWRFAPVAAVRGRSPAGTPAGATLYDPSHPEIRLEFQQRRLQFLLPESTAAGLSSRPLVLLVDENGKQPPEILDLAVEAGRWTADFPAVCALSSLLVVEPLSASIAGKP
jgi:hypothetical protein